MNETPETPLDTTLAQAPAAETPAAPDAAPQATAVPETDPLAEATPQENLLTKLVRLVDRAIRSDPKRAGWAQACWMLLDSSGERIAGPKLLEQLRAWQARYDRAVHIMSTHGYDAAKRDWLEQGRTLADAIGTGDLSKHGEAWSEADFTEDYLEKCEAARVEMRRVYTECLPACVAVSERFLVIANKKIEAMEASERERHDSFGIPYSQPSNLIVQLRKAVAVADSRTDAVPTGNSSPKSMLPYLEL